MEDEGRATSSPWKWVGIGCLVLGLVGACGVGSCLACSGLGAAGLVAVMQAPVDQTKGFFADVRGGQLEAAYARMSSTYQQEHDLAAFSEQVAGVAGLEAMTDDTVSQRSINGPVALMGGHLETPTGPVSFQVSLVNVGERWLIERVLVGDRSIP